MKTNRRTFALRFVFCIYLLIWGFVSEMKIKVCSALFYFAFGPIFIKFLRL